MTDTFPATLAQLRERVQRRLLTANSGQVDHWLDERIRDALNDGQQEIANELQRAFETRYFLKREENLTPVQNKITLPADFRRLVTFDKLIGVVGEWAPVRLVSPARHAEFRYVTFPSTTGQTYPVVEAWSISGDHIIAHGSATVSGTYRIWYVYRVPDLQADTDVSDIPGEYHDTMVFYAASLCASDAGMKERAIDMMARYDRKIGEMHKTATQVALTQQHRVRDVRGWW